MTTGVMRSRCPTAFCGPSPPRRTPKNLSRSAIQDVKMTRRSVTIECLSSWEAGKQVGDGRPQGDAVKPSAGFEVLQRPELGHGSASAVPPDHQGQRRIGDLAQGKSDFVDLEMQTVGTPGLSVNAIFQEGQNVAILGKIHAPDIPTLACPTFSHSLPIAPLLEPLVSMDHQGSASACLSPRSVPRPLKTAMRPIPTSVFRRARHCGHPNPRPSKALEDTVR